MPKFKRGDRVIIPKGTLVWRISKGAAPARRDFTITVHDVRPGYNGQPDRVVWAGSGGYWAEAEEADVRYA